MDVMQCTECGHVQYNNPEVIDSNKCLMCRGALKLADEETTKAMRVKYNNKVDVAIQGYEQQAIAKLNRNLADGKFDYRQPSKNIPKCPLCQSTNIKQISVAKRAVHGYAFGLFSNTARSQWECLNCRNKF